MSLKDLQSEYRHVLLDLKCNQSKDSFWYLGESGSFNHCGYGGKQQLFWKRGREYTGISWCRSERGIQSYQPMSDSKQPWKGLKVSTKRVIFQNHPLLFRKIPFQKSIQMPLLLIHGLAFAWKHPLCVSHLDVGWGHCEIPDMLAHTCQIRDSNRSTYLWIYDFYSRAQVDCPTLTSSSGRAYGYDKPIHGVTP